MNKTKKSIIVIIFLIISMLIGCSKERQDKQPDKFDGNKNVNSTIVDNSVEEETLITMEDLKETYPEKEILLWVYNDFLAISPSCNNAINAALVKKGYDFVILFQQIKEVTYENTINTMIADANAPDLICAGIGEAGKLQGTYRAIKNEWFENLSTYLNSNEGKVLKESYPENMWKSFEVNGNIYGVNGMLPIVTDYVYYVNKDIADKYQISLDELKELKPMELGKILEKVYQGEKAEDFATYVYEDNNYSENYSTIFDPYNNTCNPIVIDNRLVSLKAVNLFCEQDQIDYFLAMTEYKKKGYLPIENENINKKEKQDKESKGNFFIMQGSNNLFGDKGRNEIINIKNRYPKACDIEIVSYATGNISKQGNSITGICRYSEKKDMAFLALCAVFTDPEISDLFLYGMEGVDYTLKEGKAIPIGDNSFHWYISLYFGNPIISTPTLYEPMNKKEIAFDKINRMNAPDNLGKYMELIDISDVMNRINNIAVEYQGLFSGDFNDVETTLLELNHKLEEANIQYIVDEINRRMIEQ